ncbi:MAG: hypothetical protein SPI52_06780 [Bacilli bacterium]|nr:hypothetical protein [Bacilli bacterium]
MLKKLKSKKGMTMSLSIVLAVVITAVSLSVSALVATVSINQVNTAKAKYETLVLENKLYDFMNDYYEKRDEYQPKVLYEKNPDSSLIDEEKFRFKDDIAYVYYEDEDNNGYIIACDYIGETEDLDDKVDLYISTCDDFKYGQIGVDCVKYRVVFGWYGYTIKSSENLKWSFDMF